VQREFVRHPWRSGAAIVFCLLLVLAGVVLGYAIRGLIYLRMGRRESVRDLKKQYFRKAEFWFPEESGRELARIDVTDSEEARLAAFREAEKEAEELAARRREENLRNQEIARKLREEVDEAKRRALISDAYDAVLRALTDGFPSNARAPMDSLQKDAVEKYRELLPKVREAEFAEGIALLTEKAAKGDDVPFAKIYTALSGDSYSLVFEHRSRLLKPVLMLAGQLKANHRWPEALR